MRTQFVALDQDKCQFVYQICRSIAAKNVVEAGTSFGVSTIYLALAVGQNCAGERGMKGRVVATEKEAEKIAVARRYWAEAGEVVEAVIELREGDLLKTLERDLPVVDLLLLDSKYFTFVFRGFWYYFVFLCYKGISKVFLRLTSFKSGRHSLYQH